MDNIIDLSSHTECIVKKGRWQEALLYGLMWFCPQYRKGKHLVWLPEYSVISDWLDSLVCPHVGTTTKTIHFTHGEWQKDDDYTTKDLEVKTDILSRGFHGLGLLLVGSCGQGKSYISQLILPRLLQYVFGNIKFNSLVKANSYSDECQMDEHGQPIVEERTLNMAPELNIIPARLINKQVNDDGEINLLSDKSDFQVIDDLGEETERIYYGTRLMVMCDVMDSWADYVAKHGRFDVGIPVLSTNLDPDQLTAKYGSRFVSRLKRCFSHVVVLNHGDLSGNDDKPLDITQLPFYDDWAKFKRSYPNQAQRGFIGYLWGRMQIPITAADTDKEVALLLSKYDAANK